METIETLDNVAALYRRVLELTLRQEVCLQKGDVPGLPPILSEKAHIIDRTEVLLGDLSHTSNKSSEAFQAGVRVLASLVAQVVAAEERCHAFAPPSARPPARNVIAAYSAARPAGPRPGA